MASIQKIKQLSRNNEIVALFLYGFYPQVIADFYSISRERVRQILKSKKISLHEGGSFLYNRKAKDRIIKDKEEKIYKKFGCSLKLYKKLRGSGDYRKSPLWKFIEQRKNAGQRGIKWDLTLKQWWSIWEGKFHKRGICKGQLVMSRHGDNGSYSVDNIKIVTCTENTIEYYENSFGGDYSETLKNRNNGT